MKGLLTRRRYEARHRNWFDGLMVGVALIAMLSLLNSYQKQGLIFAYSADDQVMLPPSEACKLIDPDHCWNCWFLYYVSC